METHAVVGATQDDRILEEVARRVERRALWRRRREEWGTRIVVGGLLAAAVVIWVLALYGLVALARTVVQ